MKSCLEKNNLHYFTFSPNFEKPIKAANRHFLPDTPAKIFPCSLEDLGFYVIKVRPFEEHPTDKATWKPSHYSLLP
jgi:hypothetical protein